jgi:hypothetical protein
MNMLVDLTLFMLQEHFKYCLLPRKELFYVSCKYLLVWSVKSLGAVKTLSVECRRGYLHWNRDLFWSLSQTRVIQGSEESWLRWFLPPPPHLYFLKTVLYNLITDKYLYKRRRICCDFAPCSLRFRGVYHLDHEGNDRLLVESVNASETSVSFYETRPARSQKTVIFMVDVVRIWNLTNAERAETD